jgi:hypothetical protein
MHAEYCRIERWRGYFSSSFYVHLPDQTLESQSFRWRRQAPPPESGSARAAYDELVSRIERAGWKHHADGVDWFATTYTRFVETPAEVRFERVADVMPQEPPPMRFVVPVQQPAPTPPPDPAPPRVHELRPREPQPAPQPAEPQPAPAPVPARGRRWLAPTAVGTFVVAAVAAGFLILEQRGTGKPAAAEGVTRTVAAHLSTGSSGAAPITKGVEGSAHSVVAKPAQADLRVAAHGNGSWLEIRRGSATGPILYSATLTDGQTLHFRGPRLWGRFGAASNLTITANAHPVRIQGTYEKVFVGPR